MSHLLAIFKFCVVAFPVFTMHSHHIGTMGGNFSQIDILKLYKNDPILEVLVMMEEDSLKLQKSLLKLKLNWAVLRKYYCGLQRGDLENV